MEIPRFQLFMYLINQNPNKAMPYYFCKEVKLNESQETKAGPLSDKILIRMAGGL